MKDINATKINNIDPPSTPREIEILLNKKKEYGSRKQIGTSFKIFYFIIYREFIFFWSFGFATEQNEINYLI